MGASYYTTQALWREASKIKPSSANQPIFVVLENRYLSPRGQRIVSVCLSAVLRATGKGGGGIDVSPSPCGLTGKYAPI